MVKEFVERRAEPGSQRENAIGKASASYEAMVKAAKLRYTEEMAPAEAAYQRTAEEAVKAAKAVYVEAIKPHQEALERDLRTAWDSYQEELSVISAQ